MKDQNMGKSLKCLGFILFAISFTSGCTTVEAPSRNVDLDRRSCEVLDFGNQAFARQEYELAGRRYGQVQPFDQYGRGACTASVYASIATTWLLRGNAERERDPKTAATYYKRAAFWSRAFAHAEACKNGNCSDAKKFWDDGGKDIWRAEN
jgi:hypothetical protein